MKSQVLHTVQCNISGEAAGEILNWLCSGNWSLIHVYEFFNCAGKNVPVMHQGSIQMEGPSEAQASEESAMAVHVEPFVPPDELEVPQDMEIVSMVAASNIFQGPFVQSPISVILD